MIAVPIQKLVRDSTLAEGQLLGACMLGGAKTVDIVSEIVKPDDFGDPWRVRAFAAMCALVERDRETSSLGPYDVARLMAPVGGAVDMSDLEACIDIGANALTWVNADHHARRVAGAADIRRVIAKAKQMIRDAESADASEAQAFIDGAVDGLVTATERKAEGAVITTLKEQLRVVRDSARAIADGGGGETGVTTGLIDLDDRIGGLRGGATVIVGGRSGHGKTALAVSMAMAAARGLQESGTKPGAPQDVVVYVTLEVRALQLARRIVAAEARIDSRLMSRAPGIQGTEESARFVMAVNRLAPWSERLILIDLPRATVPEIARHMRRIARANKRVAVFVIDHGGLVRSVGRHQNREQAVAEIANDVTALAKSIDACAVVPVQLNRDAEKRANKRPQVSDLRESAQWEHNADVAMLLYRPAMDDPDHPDSTLAEIVVAKNRDGAPGTVRVRYDPACNRFDSAARAQQ